MPKFAANLIMRFNEVPFLDCFTAASNAGFKAVEFLFPYAFSISDIQTRLKDNDLQLVLHNLPAGNWDAGARDDHRNNLRFAADALKQEGIRLLVEPCSSYDIPGFALNRSNEGLDVIRAVGSDNLLLQYDIYHMQHMEGELAATIRKNLPQIAHIQLAHIQLADNPGRNEPGTGEINYAFLFELLDSIGYQEWIGCEYKPLKGTEAGLGWLQKIGGVEATATA
ncbi:Hydroxypyruvate isomerase [Candidatus Burkholderia pumila]|uniref:Hydroxypyruvate isomerase n=1 Tax=Candidatus Burkholderia pumila TaxID=1090375 RepID=A0ABR5HJT1_9BURK|nr:Hydroxypyruvate isomerase [Candidatus Burkholderia pumila]